MAVIFLSYGRADATDLALRIRDSLIAAGHDVWQDSQRIRAAEGWDTAIADGIRSSRVVVALISPHSVRRAGDPDNRDGKDSVCYDEISYAHGSSLPIVPVRAMTAGAPLLLHRLQAIDFRNKEEYDARVAQLLEAIDRALAGAPPERPAGTIPPAWDFSDLSITLRKRFTGRAWLFKRIESWRKENSSTGLLIVGDPGSGKSAIAAELSSRMPVVAHHFCSADTHATLNPGVFVRSIVGMLASGLEGYPSMLTAEELQPWLAKIDEDPGGAFEQLILAPLAALPPPDEVRLIVIDALDEALLAGQQTIVDLIRIRAKRLPPWLRIVATARKDPALLAGLKTFELIELDKHNVADVRAYLEDRIQGADRETTIESLTHSSGGNFLFVTTFLDAVEKKRLTFEDLQPVARRVSVVPPELAMLYGIYFSRIFPIESYRPPERGVAGHYAAQPSIATEREPLFPAQLLEILLAAREPLSREQMASVLNRTPTDPELLALIRTLAPFLPHRGGRYAPFHRSISDWLTGWDDELDQPLAGTFSLDPKKGHRALAKSTWEASPYALAHLATHRIEAEHWDEITELLLDLRYLEAKPVVGLLGDLDLALRRCPTIHPRWKLVFLISEILRLDATFLAGSPASMFQCLWNRGHWYDGPEGRFFFAEWQRQPALCELVEKWRALKEPGHCWLRCLRPPPEALGSAQRLVIHAESDGLSTVDVSPDGNRVLAAMPEDSADAGIWDAVTGARLARLDPRADGSVLSVRWFPAGPRLGLAAAVTTTGRLLLLDDELEIRADAKVSQERATRVAVSPDGRRIAAGDLNGRVELRNAGDLSLIATLHAGNGEVTAIEFSPCGRYFATGDRHMGDSNWICVFDAADGTPLARKHSQNWVVGAGFAPEGERLFWSDYRGYIEEWHWPSDAHETLRAADGAPASALRLLGTNRLLCSSGGVSEPSPIEIWNLSERRLEGKLSGHLFGVHEIAVFPGTRRFASVGDATLRVWDLDAAVEPALEPIEPEITWLAFTARGTVTASKTSRTLWVRSLDGEVLFRLQHAANLSGIAVGDGCVLAATVEGTVQLWDLESGETRWQLAPHDQEVIEVAVSPDRCRAATVDYSGRVVVIDLSSGTILRSFETGETFFVLAVSNDGAWVATGSISIWKDGVLHRKLDVDEEHLVHNDRLTFGPGEILVREHHLGRRRVYSISDGSLIADEPPADRWHWADDERNQRTLALVDARTGTVVARYPEVGGGIYRHPSGRIWANQRSRRISLLRLETATETLVPIN